MATNTINCLRTENRSYKHTEVWIVDPFGSILKRDETLVVKSPVIQTWWRDEFQIELKFGYTTRGIYLCKANVINLNPRDKIFGWTGFYNNQVTLIMGGTKRILKDEELSIGSDTLEILESLKSRIEIEFILSDDVQSTPALYYLKDRLTAIRGTQELLDFSIFVGKEEIKVTKAVLALASPVFLAMFGHDFKESQTQSVHIYDIGVDTVRRFLDFVHTFLPPAFTDLKSAVELLGMAEKYDVASLKKLCLEYVYFGVHE